MVLFVEIYVSDLHTVSLISLVHTELLVHSPRFIRLSLCINLYVNFATIKSKKSRIMVRRQVAGSSARRAPYRRQGTKAGELGVLQPERNASHAPSCLPAGTVAVPGGEPNEYSAETRRGRAQLPALRHTRTSIDKKNFLFD